MSLNKVKLSQLFSEVSHGDLPQEADSAEEDSTTTDDNDLHHENDESRDIGEDNKIINKLNFLYNELIKTNEVFAADLIFSAINKIRNSGE